MGGAGFAGLVGFVGTFGLVLIISRYEAGAHPCFPPLVFTSHHPLPESSKYSNSSPLENDKLSPSPEENVSKALQSFLIFSEADAVSTRDGFCGTSGVVIFTRGFTCGLTGRSGFLDTDSCLEAGVTGLTGSGIGFLPGCKPTGAAGLGGAVFFSELEACR